MVQRTMQQQEEQRLVAAQRGCELRHAHVEVERSKGSNDPPHPHLEGGKKKQQTGTLKLQKGVWDFGYGAKGYTAVSEINVGAM